MKNITINGKTFNVSPEGYIMIEKYLKRLKDYTINNSFDIDIYQEIELRIIEKLEIVSYNNSIIPDGELIKIVNEMGEPDEIFQNYEKKVNQKEILINKIKILFNGKANRNSSKGVLFGVCYGIGNEFKIDPIIVRLIFILLLFIYGIGAILYIILIFVMPNNE